MQLVLTHEAECRPLLRLVTTTGNLSTSLKTHEQLGPLQTGHIHYAGQLVAAVVADTPEAARYAPAVLPSLSLAATLPHARHQLLVKDEPTNQTFGDPDAALAAAAHVHDAVYSTLPEYAAALELHGLVAEWQGAQLTVHEPAQWVGGARRALAQALGITPEQVHVVSPFVGGAFGSKAYFRYHSAVCAYAARALRRPVKLVLTREQVFVLGGGHLATRQRIRLGTNETGRLQAVVHDTWSATSLVDSYQETCGYATRQHYATATLRTTHRMVPLPIATPGPMRAPGEAAGHFALESALDELAYQLDLEQFSGSCTAHYRLAPPLLFHSAHRAVQGAREVQRENDRYTNLKCALSALLTVEWETAEVELTAEPMRLLDQNFN